MENLFDVRPAIAFAKEWDLVANAELYVLTDVKVSLGKSLKIQIVPDAILQTKANIIPPLLCSRTI